MRCERESVVVVCPPGSLDRQPNLLGGRIVGRRCVGLDVHREFAQIAVWEDGVVRQAGQVATTPEGAAGVWRTVCWPTDEVAIEATCNTHAIVKLLAPRVARVVISNPMKTRAIAEAKVKTDKVDAAILAQLLAADYLPPVWMRRRGDPGAAPPGRPARAPGPPAHQAEEPGAGDPATQPDSASRRRQICSGSRAGAGWPISPCRPMRSSP